MKKMFAVLKVLAVVALFVGTCVFAFEWVADNLAVAREVLLDWSNDPYEVQVLVLWFVAAALLAPVLLLVCMFLVILYNLRRPPSDPEGMREYAASLLREADVVERYRAEQRSARLRIPRADVAARRARALP